MSQKRLVRITGLLLEVEDYTPPPAPSNPAWYAFIMFRKEGELHMGTITVADDSVGVHATVQFLDSEGHPTTADDIPQWTSTDEEVATVTPSEDGLSASIQIGGPGASVIEMRSTNDDGSEIVSQGTITVQPGDAVIGEITFTEAEEPPATP